MEQMEKVERLREKTGCSYSEAKAALDETNGDLLEALCWLEQHGKTQLVGAACSTEDREPPKQQPEPEQAAAEPGPFTRGCKSLWEGIVELIRKCNHTELVMTSKSGQREFGLPLTLFVILLLVAFWVVVVLLVVALFFGNRFSVEGTLGYQDVNDVLGKATDFAESIKEEAFPKDGHDG